MDIEQWVRVPATGTIPAYKSYHLGAHPCTTKIKGWSSASQIQMPILAALFDELCDLWTISHAIKNKKSTPSSVPVRWCEMSSSA